MRAWNTRIGGTSLVADREVVEAVGLDEEPDARSATATVE